MIVSISKKRFFAARTFDSRHRHLLSLLENGLVILQARHLSGAARVFRVLSDLSHRHVKELIQLIDRIFFRQR